MIAYPDTTKNQIVVEKDGTRLHLTMDEFERVIDAVPNVIWANTIVRRIVAPQNNTPPADLKTALSNAWTLVDETARKGPGFWRVSVCKMGFE